MRGVVDDLQQQVDQLEGILSLHTVLHVCETLGPTCIHR